MKTLRAPSTICRRFELSSSSMALTVLMFDATMERVFHFPAIAASHRNICSGEQLCR